MSWKDDDKKAYTTSKGMGGRSIRRGTRKAAKALGLGLVTGSDPVSNLAADAAKELPKAIKRSKNK